MSPELDSAHLRNALALARKVAARPEVPVLLVAETGSPSEAVAHLIHGSAAESTFVTVRCRGVAEQAVEAELFGNAVGAYVDARDSAISRAQSGTLFIDQVSHLGTTAQTRLASLMRHSVGCRVVASATTDLEAAVRERGFLAELRARLAAETISIPPLRTRPTDIARLARIYAKAAAQLLGKQIDGVSVEAITKLQTQDLSANEQQLKMIVERAVIVETTGRLRAESIAESSATRGEDALSELFDASTGELDRPATLAEIERAYIAWMLRHTRGNRTAASRMLGISYPTIAKKIAEFRIDVQPAHRIVRRTPK